MAKKRNRFHLLSFLIFFGGIGAGVIELLIMGAHSQVEMGLVALTIIAFIIAGLVSFGVAELVEIRKFLVRG